NLNILNVKGRSDLFLRLEVIKKTFITIGIICSIPYGIYGLIYFQLISNIFSYFVNTFYSGRMIDYNAFQQIRDVFPTLLLATIVGVIGWVVFNYTKTQLHLGDLVVLSITSLLYMLIYLGLSYLFKFS